jgi:hypothetical protein
MSNPHDVLPIPSSSKLYVALYNNDADHSIGVVDSTKPMMGVVKWIPIPKAGSRSPRANNLYFCGPMVYVVVEDLDDMFAVTGPGRIIVIDPRTDALDTSMMPNVITLTGKNPGGGAQDGIVPVDPKSCDQVLVADNGEFGKPLPADGGIELVDLTRRLSKGFVVTDSDLMGGPGTIASASPTVAYTIVNNPDFTTSVVALDPTNKKVLGKVFGPAGFIAFAQVSPDDQLFVGVAHGDTMKGEPGTGVYVGPANGMMLPSMGAIDLGQAPYAISFY